MSGDISKNNEGPEEPGECPIPGFNSVDEFVKNGFQSLINVTKLSNKLPSGKSRDFYEACPAFHRVMRDQAQNVLGQLTRVMRHAGCKGNIQRRDEEDRFEMLVDANDIIFERVGTLLDECAGIRRNPDAELMPKTVRPISGSWNKQAVAPPRPLRTPTHAVSALITASRNLEKPQLKFPDKIDNDRSTPFVPRISYKHNLLKPLALLLEEDDEFGQYSHPYEFELMKWSPNENCLKDSCSPYLPVEETRLVYVETTDLVDEMVEHLRKADVVAIDLEHHSYRSFQGFTCLMQISTREMDFIVDTLLLRDSLQPLNEVFTNPKIIKVLHGAQFDIQWLQRDLSLYIVGMFDTHIASRVLNYPRLALAFLLQKFCNVQAMKHFQLADWRIRPLPDEMLLYAREDTHYLIYIFEMMRSELLAKANGQDNLLRSVFTESNQLCLTRYVKPAWTTDGHLHLYHKSKRLFDNRQLYALQHLFDWRDKTARELDESTGYVLPNHMLLHIAESLPREVQGILACCNPVPPLVRQNLTPLHNLIRKAREQPLVRPVVEATQQIDRAQIHGLSSDSPLRCPHDLTWLPEFRPDLPVLLNGSDVRGAENGVNGPLAVDPIIKVYDVSTRRKAKVPERLTPFQRYKLVKQYAAAEATDEFHKTIENNKDAIQKMEIDRVQSLLKSEKKEEPSADQNAEHANISTKSNETGDNIKRNPVADPTTAEPLRAPKKGKKRKKKFDEEKLEGYDYTSVDFTDFQTNSAEAVVPKLSKVKTKHKRTGKKKFKVAI